LFLRPNLLGMEYLPGVPGGRDLHLGFAFLRRGLLSIEPQQLVRLRAKLIEVLASLFARGLCLHSPLASLRDGAVRHELGNHHLILLLLARRGFRLHAALHDPLALPLGVHLDDAEPFFVIFADLL